MMMLLLMLLLLMQSLSVGAQSNTAGIGVSGQADIES